MTNPHQNGYMQPTISAAHNVEGTKTIEYP